MSCWRKVRTSNGRPSIRRSAKAATEIEESKVSPRRQRCVVPVTAKTSSTTTVVLAIRSGLPAPAPGENTATRSTAAVRMRSIASMSVASRTCWSIRGVPGARSAGTHRTTCSPRRNAIRETSAVHGLSDSSPCASASTAGVSM
jgi:hypothetical protein